MNRRTFLDGVSLATAAAVTGVAGCLGGGGGGPAATTTEETTQAETTAATDTTTTTGATNTTATGGSGATVTVSSHPEHGDILADAEGMTLYLFTRDEGGESACYDSCAQAWPPLTVEGDPTAGDGVTAELGTTERDDGSTQVTAAGHPLYYYAPDEQPGDATGQGVGGVWFVLGPDGAGKGMESAGSGGNATNASGDGGNGTGGNTTGDGNGSGGGGGSGDGGGGGGNGGDYEY